MRSLKDEYPWCSEEIYIEVSDEIAQAIAEFVRNEKAQQEKIRYHRAFYSLNAGEGIDNRIVFVSASPQEIYERKVTNKEIYKAMQTLKEKQAKRIYARYFQDMTVTQIARIEHTSVMAVSKSINKGLKKIEEILKKGV